MEIKGGKAKMSPVKQTSIPTSKTKKFPVSNSPNAIFTRPDRSIKGGKAKM